MRMPLITRQALIGVLCASLVLQGMAHAQPVPQPSAAHAQGIAAGQAANPAARGAVNPQSAGQVVPGYGTPAPQTQFYGQTELRGTARAQLAACAAQPPDQRDPVCTALQGAQTSAQTPRPGLSANDPAVLAARRIGQNPAMSLGDMSRFYSACRVQSTNTAPTERRACRRALGPGGAASGGGSTLSCSRRLHVSVERQLDCTPGQWTAQGQSAGFEVAAQCRPEPLPQRLRLTGPGQAPLFFDLRLDQPLTAPRPVVRLGTGEQVWQWEQTCTGDVCTVRLLVEPLDPCANASSEATCTAAPSPFTFQYAACPAGSQPADAFAVETPSGAPVADPARCYPLGPVPQGAGTPRATTGFALSSRGAAATQLTLALTRHREQINTVDSWSDECQGMSLEGRCERAGPEICQESGRRNVDGINLDRACWRYETPLRCGASAGPTAPATPPDDCADLQHAGCTLQEQVCLQTDAQGRCRLQEGRYACPAQPAQQTQVSDCPTGEFCVGESCFNTRYASDADFARTMSLMEAAREAGMYLDPDRLEVFQGEANRCRDRLLNNCCSTNAAGSGMSNQRVFGMGSKLVFDILMNAQNRAFVYAGITALLTGSNFQGTFTSYGVSVSFNGAVMEEGLTILYMGDNVWVAYDPWTLAITVVFMVIMAAASCDAEEGRLALKEGARLCHTVGDYCSTCLRVLGHCTSCITRTRGKCCFNSMLARIINEQGRGQVGKSWGSAENPDCSGFTVEQLQRLNFGTMDLSEFYASILAALPPATDAVNGPGAERARRCVTQGGCR